MNRSIDITFILHIKLLNQRDKTRRYIFDTGRVGFVKDRISLFTFQDKLVFCVIDRGGISYSVETPSPPLEQSFSTLIFEIKSEVMGSTLRIYKNEEAVASSIFTFPIICTENPFKLNYFIGSDIRGNDSASFEVAEQAIYEKALTREERASVLSRFQEKHYPKPKTAMRFINGAYLFRDPQSNMFIQPVPANQPIYLSPFLNE